MRALVTPAAILLTLTSCGDVPEEDDGPPPTAVRSALASTVVCPGVSCLPTTAKYLGTVVSEDELGPVESERMNGLANSRTHWFWMHQTGIQRVPMTKGMTGQVDRSTGIPKAFADLGYDHLGDGDFYGGSLYVPASGGPLPVVLVFDENLNLRSWAALEHGGEPFLAINPIDHRLYSGGPFRTLKVYDVTNLRPAEIAPTSDMSSAGLGFIGTIPLRPARAHDEDWWKDVWVQGGAFSPNGVFYYVLDHGTADESAFTGVYVFDVTPIAEGTPPSAEGVVGPAAWQVNVAGDGPHGILPVSYDPIQHAAWVAVGRGDELEGIAVYRGDDDKIHVLLQLLSNELEDDDVTIHQWTTDEPRKRTPATPTIAEPAADDWQAQFVRLGTDRASGVAAALLANALR